MGDSKGNLIEYQKEFCPWHTTGTKGQENCARPLGTDRRARPTGSGHGTKQKAKQIQLIRARVPCKTPSPPHCSQKEKGSHFWPNWDPRRQDPPLALLPGDQPICFKTLKSPPQIVHSQRVLFRGLTQVSPVMVLSAGGRGGGDRAVAVSAGDAAGVGRSAVDGSLRSDGRLRAG